LKVNTVMEAEEKAGEYRDAENKVNMAEGNYELELSDDTIDELKRQLVSFGDISEVRSQDEISDDIVNVRIELNKLESGIKDAKDQIAGWTEEYENNENVILKLSEVSGDIKGIEKELKSLPHLPEGFDSPDDFVNHVNTLDTDTRRLEREISEKKIAITQKQNEAPELSSEELQSMYTDAQFKYEQLNKEAETFSRVYEKSMAVIEQLDQNTYQGLDESFMKWLTKMIPDRFSSIELDRDIPIEFKTNDKNYCLWNYYHMAQRMPSP
jgi:DNA repair protein SbcC/Rad50